MARLKICITLCFLFSAIVYAQNNADGFYISGKVKVDQGVVEGTTIQIACDGQNWKKISLNRTGGFRVAVNLGHVYDFTYSKTGYYSKKIEVDTKLPAGTCDGSCNFPPYQMAVLIYKKVPGVESMAGKTARVSYNPKIDNFEAEILRDASENSINIDAVITETKEKSKKYEQRSLQQKKKQYQALINDADRIFQQGGYEFALKKYRDALFILPNEKYPRQQINKTYQLQVAKTIYSKYGRPSDENIFKYLNYGDKMFSDREYTMAKVAYEKALSVKPNDASIKSKYEKAKNEIDNMQRLAFDEVNQKQMVYDARKVKYEQLVAEGNRLLKLEDYAGAKSKYAIAASQIDENSYALLMIEKIDEVLNNEDLIERLAMERKNEEMASLRDARNRAYNDAVEEADRLFESRLYRDAIEYYELALTVKNYELYPKKQIRIIGDILASLQLKGEQYNKLLRQADNLMLQRQYEKARPVYESAHKLIPDEKYALGKIDEIDRLLKMPDEHAVNMQAYNEYIKKGDDLFKAKDYANSINSYQQALNVFPSKAYPTNQIAKIKLILSRENKSRVDQEELEANYRGVVEQADATFKQKSYQSARTLYLEALNIIPGREYPQKRIREVDQLLRELLDAERNKTVLEQIDFSNLDNISENVRRAAYEEAMALGQSFFENKEWALARFYFRRAFSLIPGDAAAEKRIAEVEQYILGENAAEARFAEMVQKADEAYKTGDFGVARFYYTKAHEYKPDDAYVSERLKVSGQLVATTAKRATNRGYDDAMNKASEAMSEKNYSVARFFYRKALSLKANDAKALEEISKIEKLMEK